MKEIWHEISIKSAPGTIYQALTQADKLAQWWIPDTRGESRPGNILEFRFGDGCQLMRVSALEPDRLVCWQPTKEDDSDWAGTQIQFTVLPVDGQSTVQFRHSGFRGNADRYPYYSMSWAVFLLSLKQLVEDGEGFPFPNRWIHQ
ncbi:SRPBCC domain-containing protein [Mesorhizobium sp. Mes31]|uniref:SRPBCC family protein n=1 Tax=Mesorhizobium sp. Mes31 TaxID=2926017 RepID=UPI002119AED9|nr:SRPBCC domain-containing protein [Mesorhizobium sp. Mes31]